MSWGVKSRKSGKKAFNYKVKNKRCLQCFCFKQIKIGSKAYADKWKGYPGLYETGYIRKTVNHKKEFVNSNDRTSQTIKLKFYGESWNLSQGKTCNFKI